MTEAPKAKRRPGRPTKPPPRGKKRIQISMIMSTKTKVLLDQEAKGSGRTVSQVGEELIEYALSLKKIEREIGQPLAQIAAKNFQAEMYRRGWRTYGDPKRPGLWLEPPYVTEDMRSRFIPPTEEEKAALELRGELVVRPDDMTDEEWAQFNEDRKAGRIKEEER